MFLFIHKVILTPAEKVKEEGNIDCALRETVGDRRINYKRCSRGQKTKVQNSYVEEEEEEEEK